MSEEKNKAEKWEKSNWFLYINSEYSSTYQYISSKKLIDMAFKYGKVIISDNNFSIGDFTLRFDNIRKIEKKKSRFIIIYCADGSTYRLFAHFMGHLTISAKQMEKVYSILFEKVKEFENERYNKTVEYFKNLPNLYDEISFEDLISRTSLSRPDIIKIIEKLVFDGEINAVISSNMLKFKKEPEAKVSPIGYTSETSSVQESEEREEMLVFVSYATKDAELYKIPEVVRMLEEYKDIGKVLYWQEDMHDSIIEYMNDNLGKCNGVLLFCSPNALESIPVKKEWMAAEALKKPIIPIFFKPEHIPPLLSDRLGLEFDNFDFQKNVREIHDLFLKKTRS
jgi:DNA-binding Lrp family transcriptional regulator